MSITETDMGLEVTPVDDQLSNDGSIHQILPQPPFSLMITAPKGSGKSTLINRLIAGVPKRKDKEAIPYYKRYFDRVHVFSPSWRLDGTKTKRLNIPDDQITTTKRSTRSSSSRFCWSKKSKSWRKGRTNRTRCCSSSPT